MKAVVTVFGILAGIALVNIIFFAPNSSQVIGSVFSGSSTLFGTLTKGST